MKMIMVMENKNDNGNDGKDMKREGLKERNRDKQKEVERSREKQKEVERSEDRNRGRYRDDI